MEFERGELFIDQIDEILYDFQQMSAVGLRLALNVEDEVDEGEFTDISSVEAWLIDAAQDYKAYCSGLSEIGYSLSDDLLKFFEAKEFHADTAAYYSVIALTYFDTYCVKKAKPEMDFTVNALRLAVDGLTDRLEGLDLLHITALCPALRHFQDFLIDQDFQDKALYTQSCFQIDQFHKELKGLFESRIDERLPCFALLQSYPAMPWEDKEFSVLDKMKERSKLRSKRKKENKSLFRKVFGL